MFLHGRKNRRERQMSDLLESTICSLPSKLHSVATFTVVQSLLMVLVMHTQLEATLSFLEQIPDVSEQSSMVFVLQEWTSYHPSFFGKWETRMSSLAMADLLSHYLSTGDKYLVAIETVSKEVVKPSEGTNNWCSEVRCGEVECSVVPSHPLCIHCRYHDTVMRKKGVPLICSTCCLLSPPSLVIHPYSIIHQLLITYHFII